jgi:two-component system LytT family response regulator
MNPIRTLIVDDEPLARRRLRNLLRGADEFEVVGECANGREAVSAIRERTPDLVFLDVQMPDLDGFGVLAALGPTRLPVVVFVTAYDQYALRAFEFHALDYLLKPFDDERFEKTLGWARSQLREKQLHRLSERMVALLDDYRGGQEAGRGAEAQPAGQPQLLTRLVVKSAGHVCFVRVEEIDWIEAEGYYARLHVGGKSHLLRETMAKLEAQLDPRRFLRIHRSTIVNLDRVRELRPQSHGEYAVILHDGTPLRLSRSYRDRLPALLGRRPRDGQRE